MIADSFPVGTGPVAMLCSSGLHVKLLLPLVESLPDDCTVLILSADNFYAGVHGDVRSTVQQLTRPPQVIDLPVKAVSGGRWRYLLGVWWSLGLNINASLRNFLRDLRPSCIVLGNDTGHLERAVIRYARILRIRTILIQDGFLLDDFHGPLFSRMKLWFAATLGARLGGIEYGMGGTDIMLAFGDYWQRILLRRRTRVGQSVHKYPVGYARLRIESQSDAAGHVALVSAGELSYVLYFCTNFLSAFGDRGSHVAQLREIGTLHKWLQTHFHGKVSLKVKLHPADRLVDYNRLQGMETQGLQVLDSGDLTQLIDASWLCVTNYSSAFIHAILRGRLCLLSSMGVRRRRLRRFIRRLPGIHVDIPDDWHILIRLQDNSDYQAMLKQQDQALDQLVMNPKETAMLVGQDLFSSWCNLHESHSENKAQYDRSIQIRAE